MKRVILTSVVFGVSAIGLAAQQLTVVPSTFQGVELVGYGSPGFDALVTQIVGTARPTALAAALPYGVIVRNRTSQPIAAIDTVWTAKNEVLLNAADAMFNKPLFYVNPGQAALVVPAGILQNPRQLQIFADGSLEHHRLENFRHPGQVTVVVDSVVFESGQFEGADRYGAFERWQAQIQAPRDLAASVLERRGAQSAAQIAKWLNGLASPTQAPSEPSAQERVFSARVLLAAYRSKGEAELYARAQSVLDAPVFPLHR